MADYYPLIARAVSRLESNTGEGRQVLYARARASLIALLRENDSSGSESQIALERLALEMAIRRVEEDAPHLIDVSSAPTDAVRGLSGAGFNSGPRPRALHLAGRIPFATTSKSSTVLLIVSVILLWRVWLQDPTSMSIYWVARCPGPLPFRKDGRPEDKLLQPRASTRPDRTLRSEIITNRTFKAAAGAIILAVGFAVPVVHGPLGYALRWFNRAVLSPTAVVLDLAVRYLLRGPYFGFRGAGIGAGMDTFLASFMSGAIVFGLLLGLLRICVRDAHKFRMKNPGPVAIWSGTILFWFGCAIGIYFLGITFNILVQSNPPLEIVGVLVGAVILYPAAGRGIQFALGR